MKSLTEIITEDIVVRWYGARDISQITQWHIDEFVKEKFCPCPYMQSSTVGIPGWPVDPEVTVDIDTSKWYEIKVQDKLIKCGDFIRKTIRINFLKDPKTNEPYIQRFDQLEYIKLLLALTIPDLAVKEVEGKFVDADGAYGVGLYGLAYFTRGMAPEGAEVSAEKFVWMPKFLNFPITKIKTDKRGQEMVGGLINALIRQCLVLDDNSCTKGYTMFRWLNFVEVHFFREALGDTYEKREGEEVVELEEAEVPFDETHIYDI